MSWEILALLLLTLSVLIWLKRRKYYKLAKELKNNIKCWPILGHAYLFVGDDEDRMNALKKIGREALAQGGITHAWLGHRIFAVIANPEIAECILKQCLEKDDVVKVSKYVTGNGSIFAPASEWRPRRKMLLPLFSQKALNQFVHAFARQSSTMAAQLADQAGSAPCKLWKYFSAYTMDSVCETTLGVKLEAQKNPDQPFLKAFDGYCHLVSARMCQPWLHNDFFYQMLPDFKLLTAIRDCMHGFIDEIVHRKRKELQNSNRNTVDASKPFKTFLELLMETSSGEQGYSDVALKEETLVIVMAGTDTSAVGTAFAAVMLSRYSEVQEKVFEELKEVFGDSKRPVTPEDLPRLKYLDAVIKETLRLYPPIPLTARKISNELCLPSGVTLPVGCGVIINVWALHRNPKYWGADAEQFRPERFLNIDYKHPAQFHAFSYGARNCVGYQYAMLSSKTALATLLRHYRLLPANENGSKTIRLKFDIMLKDVQDCTVRLAPRI